jgi:hypothetical protein
LKRTKLDWKEERREKRRSDEKERRRIKARG